MKTSSRLAFRAVLIYGFIAGLWIIFSDRLLEWLITNPEWLTRFQTCKGLAFVAVTSVFFYFMLRNQLEKWEKETGERMRTQVALHANQEKMRAIFDAEPACLKLLEADATLCEINPAGLQIIEADRMADIVGQSILQIVVSSYREEVCLLLEEVAQGTKRNLEFQIIGLRGTTRWLDMHAVPFCDPITGKNLVLAVSRDITQRKKLEDEVILREQQLNIFFTNAPAGLVLLDADLRYVQLNAMVAEINGLSIHDHLGKTIREILPKFAPIVEPLLLKVLATGEPVLNIELAGETPSQPGVIRYWMESFFPIFGKDGKPNNIGVIFVEITERKLAENELRWKTAFLEAQVDSALDGILVVDSQGKRILQNQRMIEIWKVPSHIAENTEHVGQLKFAADQTKNPQQFMDKVLFLYAHPDEISRDEVELIDGAVLDRYSSPVRDKSGKHYGRIWTFRDITERRNLEAQFRQAQKMDAIGQLASGVAHDFNNILAVIQLQADLLAIDATLLPSQRDFASEIGKAAQRAANLTRQLILFSRKQTMRLYDYDLNDIVTNITKMLQRVLGEHVQMQFNYAPQTLLIHADTSMMDQVLMNLAVNARDAMPKSGQLVIETSAVDFDAVSASNISQARPGSFVCLKVSDTGNGIPAEILPRIFEPFFTTKDIGKGTGLGLATIFGIVQQHQGWINVHSEVGQGTVFSIYLPRIAKAEEQNPIPPAIASMPRGNETILLVEDDNALRSSISNTLSNLGYRILEASTGAEGFEVWRKHSEEIHLLLTDLMMPGGISGKELAEQLLQNKPQLKVLYASGYSGDIVGTDFILQEGDNFIPKPFEAQKLAQTIRNCLDRI